MKKLISLFILLFTFVNQGWATTNANESPYSVVYNHLYYLQQEHYDLDKSKKSFQSDNQKEAIQLKKLLDAKGIYVDINLLPKESNFIDSVSKKSILILNKREPRIYVEKTENGWFYSKTTVSLLPQMMKETFPIGTKYIDKFHGPAWNYKLLGLALSKWFSLILLLFICVLSYLIIHKLSLRVFKKFLSGKFQNYESIEKNASNITRLVGLILSAQLFKYFEPYFGFSAQTNNALLVIIRIASIVFLTLLLVKISKLVFRYFANLATKTENTMDDQLVPVAQKIASLIIWAIGILYVLESLQVNITALLAGISIGGLAIALAAQDTVKNFFGSIMIFLDKPFQIGDWVNFDSVDGTVEEVGLRSTRIRTFANSVVYVPNGMLADKVVNNMGLRKYRRFKTDIGITYDTDPQAIDAFVEGIRGIIMTHPTTRKDYFEVHLNSFGASSINILLYCFFEAPDWTAELRGRHDVMFGIMMLAKDLGVEFAFPTQTLHIESTPDTSVEKNRPEYNLDNSLSKINQYFKETKAGARQDKFRPLGGE